MSSPSELDTTPLIAFPGTIHRARFERRYKRFFVDCVLEDSGEGVTAHTPNTGSMAGLLSAGAPCWLTHDPAPHRKLAYTLQALRADDAWVGCNTQLPNAFAAALLAAQGVPELGGYTEVQREVTCGPGSRSRIDLRLRGHSDGAPDVWVEVKNVTLREGSQALFPDAVSERGRKHLGELQAQVAKGERAAMLYIVQRDDCAAFAPARRIDPAYADALREAHAAGVEVYALRVRVEERGLFFAGRLPVHLTLPV